MKISESLWYMNAQDDTRWKAICSSDLYQHMMAPLPDKPFLCTSHHSFEENKICREIFVPTLFLVNDTGMCNHSRIYSWLQCLYVCMYVCMHVCMHVRMYVSTYIYVFMYVYIYVHLRTYMHAGNATGLSSLTLIIN